MDNNKKSKTYIAGINLGNLDLKIIGDEGKTISKASAKKMLLSDILDLDSSLKSDKNFISVDGEYYEMGYVDAIDGDIKSRPANLMRAIFAHGIGQQLTLKKKTMNECKKADYVEIKAVLGLPIKECMDKENVEYVKNLFAREYNIHFMDLKTKIVLDKKNILILPEGYAHFQMNYNMYKKYEDLYICDIGSRTIDSIRIIKGQPKEPSTAPDQGTIFLMKEIKTIIGDDSMPQNKLDTLLKEGKVVYKGVTYRTTDKQIASAIKNFKDNVVEVLRLKHENINSAEKIIFLGGGSYLVDGLIQSEFPGHIEFEFVKNAEFANADAYYVYALNKFSA